MKDLDAIYSREWYEHDFDGLQPEFDRVGDVLEHIFCPFDAIDVGCGPGLLVKALRRKGVEAFGFDGSSHAIGYAREHVGDVLPYLRQFDITKTTPATVEGAFGETSFDMVICTEVAEHLEAEHADRLIELLCALVAPKHSLTVPDDNGSRPGGVVVFTAAPPGQGGHDHVNERPMGYWIDKFNANGFGWHELGTRAVAAAWEPLERLSHMRRNVAIFNRRQCT